MSMNPLRDIGHLSHKMRSIAQAQAKEYDVELLAGPQGHVLHYLAHHQEEEIVIKDIEQQLQISKSVASNLIKRMEKNGFIIVEVSAKDKRKKIIHLSESSKEKAKNMGIFWSNVAQMMTEGIAPADLEVFSRVIKQMSQNVEKIEKGEKYD